VLEAAIAVDHGVTTLAASEVPGIEDAVVPAPKARKTSPCGSVGPPEPGSCEEPSADKVAAREVEALEDVVAVVPETACCFSCTDWQTANTGTVSDVGEVALCSTVFSPSLEVQSSNSPNTTLTVTWDTSVCTALSHMISPK
jgi:hypothetical protein